MNNKLRLHDIHMTFLHMHVRLHPRASTKHHPPRSHIFNYATILWCAVDRNASSILDKKEKYIF